MPGVGWKTLKGSKATKSAESLQILDWMRAAGPAESRSASDGTWLPSDGCTRPRAGGAAVPPPVIAE